MILYCKVTRQSTVQLIVSVTLRLTPLDHIIQGCVLQKNTWSLKFPNNNILGAQHVISKTKVSCLWQKLHFRVNSPFHHLWQKLVACGTRAPLEYSPEICNTAQALQSYENQLLSGVQLVGAQSKTWTTAN